MNTERVLAALIAVLAAVSLGVQTTIGEGSVLENAAGLLRFFTIWGNVAACAVMAAAALGKRIAPRWMAALATMLLVIASVYWVLLASEHHPVGIDRLTNQVFHTIVPLATIAWWLRYTEATDKILPAVPIIMVPPLAYGAFAAVQGAMTGFYPYFFLDLPELGLAQFAINNIVLAIFFGVLGAGMLALKNRLGRSF